MELINATRMVAGYTMATDCSGRELLVVVIKGTFRFPEQGESSEAFALHEDQQSLVMADVFTGEPGYSAPTYECDFAPRKPRCDILLLGSAHAPQGRPARHVEVGLQVGKWSKSFAVTGRRHWECVVGGVRSTPPEYFVRQAISYDVGFGGADLHHEDPSEHASYVTNPVGRGFHKHIRREWVDGALLPLTEELRRSVSDPAGDYRPMSFGPIGRAWEPRFRFAGTYDDRWLREDFPFLPPDFDEQYFQAAPLDQQVPLGSFQDGPAEVLLTNLTPEGRTRLTLPRLAAPVHVFPKRGEREDYTAALDTIVIESDARLFTLTWRMTRPLQRNIFEVAQVLVGRKGREWWQHREMVAFPVPVIMVPKAQSDVVKV